MSQTTNLGLPLWGETPPGSLTGRDLRNAIIGENEDSMAQILDAKVERLANKVAKITDDATEEQYPNVRAVKDYIGLQYDNVADRLLPLVDTSDTGKVLTVGVKGVEWQDPAVSLPESTAEDNGKVLTVNEVGEAMWANPLISLPESSTDDIGKALFVGEDGAAVWSEPVNELPDVTISDVGKFLGVLEDGTWGLVAMIDGNEVEY